ncbi:hypothetical protein OG439_09270 [Amycolatopsis sp. NBC_01307]|uniref:hypothetical protein n=1 Tax=Amycolatopsis sp. NBC_01307 TaxID=2903561 RepID=UPI002E14D6B6|nr:hypothetical protein OG439_09270 [Amycolatopsis sp. NBC_01307]
MARRFLFSQAVFGRSGLVPTVALTPTVRESRSGVAPMAVPAGFGLTRGPRTGWKTPLGMTDSR